MSEKSSLLPTTLSYDPPTGKGNYVLVIHGGAGTMSRSRSTPEQRARYKAALTRALRAGYEVLQEGGEAMDAAVAAVSSMEGGFTTTSGMALSKITLRRLSVVQLCKGCSVQYRGKGKPSLQFPLVALIASYRTNLKLP